MKQDKEEKKFSFEGFPFKEMTDEEFEQWAENHARTYNSFVKSYKAQDPKLFVSETGSLAFELMPLIFIKMVFCNEEIKEITKTEDKVFARAQKYLNDILTCDIAQNVVKY
jgi:FMN-dependent NADH-azoreductase